MRFFGIPVVIGCVLAGFVLSGGEIPVLFQPYEFLIILGAAFGALTIAIAPRQMKVLALAVLSAFKGSKYGPALAGETLTCLYEFSILVKKVGVVSLESHILEPEKSEVFSRYPRILAHPEVLDFICDSFRLQVDGAVGPAELDEILGRELDCMWEEDEAYPEVLQKLADSLPGLGIVAAVLGIVITMSHLDGDPAQVGHHVAVALVGTFLGVLLSYGFAQPMVTALEHRVKEKANFFEALRVGMVAFAEGKAPVVTVEVVRRSFFSHNRPGREKVEEDCREARGARAA